MGELLEEAEQAIDPVLIELCRLRLALLLDCRSEQARRSRYAQAAGLTESRIEMLDRWVTSPAFSNREKICLEFTEQFLLAPDEITIGQRVALEETLGTAGAALEFAQAIHVFESYQRLLGTYGAVQEHSEPR
jgi:alkylhydroperoxidase family enzyme